MKAKILLLLINIFVSGSLLAQQKEAERTYVCHNKNGTSEVVYFQGNTNVAMHVYYMSSTNKQKIKLDVLGYESRTRTYSVQFPNAPKDEVYKFTLTSNANMQCRNPDGTIQNFILSDDAPMEFVSKNHDGSKEMLSVITSDTQHHIESIFYSSSTSKSKMELIIVSKDDKNKKYKVRFPNNSQLYSLDWQMDKTKKMNQVLLLHPNGVAQVFLSE